MYAIFTTGGKQYKVEAGQQLYIEKLNKDVDADVTFDQVIAIGDDKKGLLVGKDVEKATVVAKVVKNGKAKKINVFTYKPKKGQKRSVGHRQPYTLVEIVAINAKPKRAPAKKKVEAEAPAAAEAAAE